MADNLHSSPAPAVLQEDANVPPQNPSGIVIWTISGDNPEVIPYSSSIPQIPVVSPSKLKRLSHGSNQSSTGVFELQEGEVRINQREEPGNVRARIVYSILMMLVGLALILVGIICEFNSTVPGGGVPFWVIGSLLLIPGIYCTWDSVVTLRQLGSTERQQIFKDESERVDE